MEILKMDGVTKDFPGVKALNKVNITVNSGEVHALLGENGAGKSTLMKILSGVYHQDEGKIFLRGEEVHIKNVRHAQQLGISIIYQEINICSHLTIADNIFIGRQKSKFGIVDKKYVDDEAQKILDRMNLKMKASDRVMGMGIAKRQLIEIAKAISFESDVIVFDEPTAALSNDEIFN
ncbi:MAG: ATP-binding cassette domain-containing protein [Ruminiclostridium sp.]